MPDQSARRWKYAFVAATVGLVVVVAGIVAAWPEADHSDSGSGFDSSRIFEAAGMFPAGSKVDNNRAEITLRENVGALLSSEKPQVTPASCQKYVDGIINPSRVVGTRVRTINGYSKGVQYTITAQTLPEGTPTRAAPDAACQELTYEYSDGSFALATSPNEIPNIDGVRVDATRIVMQTNAKQTIDTFTFKGWIDGRHVVAVQAKSDPNAKPAANPIDPTFAKSLFVETVKLVRGQK
ncbi:DUF5642 family protein [Tsukamurella sp. NPDC003166]|uniref:DUF5642 family protein n=1 Tax=Tsukamurella sp. NPDC003166 TaxID=3154444 RepID=UPI0033B37DEE